MQTRLLSHLKRAIDFVVRQTGVQKSAALLPCGRLGWVSPGSLGVKPLHCWEELRPAWPLRVVVTSEADVTGGKHLPTWEPASLTRASPPCPHRPVLTALCLPLRPHCSSSPAPPGPAPSPAPWQQFSHIDQGLSRCVPGLALPGSTIQSPLV